MKSAVVMTCADHERCTKYCLAAHLVMLEYSGGRAPAWAVTCLVFRQHARPWQSTALGMLCKRKGHHSEEKTSTLWGSQAHRSACCTLDQSPPHSSRLTTLMAESLHGTLATSFRLMNASTVSLLPDTQLYSSVLAACASYCSIAEIIAPAAAAANATRANEPRSVTGTGQPVSWLCDSVTWA